jgi:predicted transcriptional regulator
MKILIKKKQTRSVTLRLADEVMRRIDDLAKENKISRQLIIESILETAMNLKDFEIKVSKSESK